MRISGTWAVLGTAIGVFALGALAASPALASPTPNISFYTQGASTASWLPNHSAVQLTVPDKSSYAIVVFHHVSSAIPTTAPSFTAPQYASGSPRWYIQLSTGPYLFGYPGDDWNVNECAGVNNGTNYTYTQAIAALSNCDSADASVSAVYIVADSSQPVPATDVISAIQYNSVAFTNS